MSYILSDSYVRIEPVPASFGARIVAAVIDGAVLLLYVVGLTFILSQVFFWQGFSDRAIVLLYFMPPIFYYPVMECLTGGRSVGKMVMGLRVVNADGSRPSIATFFLRWLLLPIDTGTGFMVGTLCILLTKNGQRLGDLAAGTMVVSDRLLNNNRVSLGEFGFLTTDYHPHFPAAEQLTPGQVEAIRQTLNLAPAQRMAQIERIYPKVAAIVGPRPPQMSEELYLTLVWRDYQYYQS